MKSTRKARVLGCLGGEFVRALGCTWRVRVDGHHEIAPRIYALLHGNLLLPAFRLRRSRAAVMISRHADGELIASAVRRLGFVPVRGSSTRGAALAMHELLRDHGDRPWVVTPDGPKGPRGSVKPGLIRFAAAAGRPIQPLVGAARPAKVFGSWDGFTLPWPLARVVVHFGEPMPVPAEPDDQAVGELVVELERRLATAEKAAADALARW